MGSLQLIRCQRVDMSRNGFRYTYICLTALAWTVFFVIMYGSAKDRSMSSLIDEKDPHKREDVNNSKSMEKFKDFGLQQRNDKLANKILQEDIQKENDEIIKSLKISDRESDSLNDPINEIDEQKSLKDDKRINPIVKNAGKIGNVNDKEKDKGRKILNEKEKGMKSKMGKRLKDQLKDHKNEAIDQIISDIQ